MLWLLQTLLNVASFVQVLTAVFATHMVNKVGTTAVKHLALLLAVRYCKLLPKSFLCNLECVLPYHHFFLEIVHVTGAGVQEARALGPEQHVSMGRVESVARTAAPAPDARVNGHDIKAITWLFADSRPCLSTHVLAAGWVRALLSASFLTAV